METKRFIVPRDVIFNETKFPYASDLEKNFDTVSNFKSQHNFGESILASNPQARGSIGATNNGPSQPLFKDPCEPINNSLGSSDHAAVHNPSPTTTSSRLDPKSPDAVDSSQDARGPITSPSLVAPSVQPIHPPVACLDLQPGLPILTDPLALPQGPMPSHTPSRSTRTKTNSSKLWDFVCNSVWPSLEKSHSSFAPPPSSDLSGKFLYNTICELSKVLLFIETFFSICNCRTFNKAISNPKWRFAMRQEIDALEHNKTWTPISLPPGKHALSSKWVF